jgi:light-regulated signal transduction histidine kinase (bacteriophytochrome)
MLRHSYDFEPVSSRAARARTASVAAGTALANLAGRISASGGTVPHDPLRMLVADTARLSQVFQNLISRGIFDR